MPGTDVTAAIHTTPGQGEYLCEYFSARQNSYLWQIRQNRNMKYTLPILTVVVLLAAGWAGWRVRQRDEGAVSNPAAAVPMPQTPTTAAAAMAGSGSATDVLHASIRMIEACTSLHCRVRHQVNLYGQQIKGSGEYVQGASRRHQFRLELKLHSGEESATLLQVCDGRSMWTYRQLGDRPSLGHVDLRRVQDELGEEDIQATWYPWRDLGGIGGLPHLLRGLDETFRFTSSVPGTLDGSPVWILKGRWRAAPLRRLLKDQKDAINAGGEIEWGDLSPHAPDHVAVIIGRDDRLPYRIEFRRSTVAAGTITAPLDAGDDASEMLLVMEFYRVRLGEEVDPQLFEYKPRGLAPRDHTDRYVTALRASAGRRSKVGPAVR